MNHQSRRSLTERGLSLLCAAAMVAGVVLGNVDTPRASASEQVLVCGQNEHTHGDGCYQKQFTCSQGEHTHSDSCRNENGEIVCGKGEHAHADGCYTNALICGQSEHKHGAECYIVRAVKSETVPETQQKSAPETQPTAENTEPQSKAETSENAGNTQPQSKAETPENAGNTQPQSASDTQQSAGNTQPQSTADTQQGAGNAQEQGVSDTQQSTAGTQSTEGGSDAADTQPTEGQSDAAGTQPTEGQSNAEGTQQPTEGQSDAAGTQPTEGQSGTAGTQPTENQSDAAETQSDAESEAKELKASVTTKATYAVAGKEDLVFETKVAGGAAPYTVKYAIKLDDKIVYEQNDFSEKVTYRPESYGVHTIYMEATDAAGKTSKAECSVPVAVDETENADIWKQSVQSVTLTGDYAKDIAAIAKTQLGTKENKKNFIINKEGTAQYYSRYGQWYGDTYEEWSAMFGSFCAAYAQIPEKYLPREKDNSKWAEKLGDRYVSKDGYTPQAGDLVFFGENPHKDGTTQLQTGSPAHVGIVIEVDADAQTFTTVEGNAGGEVSRQQYSLSETKIAGYMSMAKVTELAKADQGETSGETDTENDVQTETEAPEFIVVKMVLGDVAHWVMGAEGTDHSWQVLDNQEIIRIEDGSGDTAKIMPLAAGKAFLIHNYTADDEICMETFEVEVVETAEESESETADEGESGATGESETESETETETGDGTGSGKKTEYITLTTDDVILRAQPSVEADVIAVMDSGAKLELLDIVEAEDAEWYKVVYRGTGALMQKLDAENAQDAQITVEGVEEGVAQDGGAAIGENAADQPAETVPAADTGQAAQTAPAAESAAQADPSASAEDSAASAGDTAQAGEAAADAAAGDAAGGSSAGGAAADSSAAANQNPGVEAYVRSDLADILQETEPAPEVMTYEDEEVVINVTEVTEGAIPENATLKVVPLKKDDAATAEQYAQVEAKLLEKAENEAYDIAGFLAYDITFVDETGAKLEPNGEVKVSIDYRQPTIPAEVTESVAKMEAAAADAAVNNVAADAAINDAAVADVAVDNAVSADTAMDSAAAEIAPMALANEMMVADESAESSEIAPDPIQVTVMHLEEDESGNVQSVVDMAESSQLELVDTTAAQEVQKAEFVTDSFSYYTVTWKYGSGWFDWQSFRLYYVDNTGVPLPVDGVGDGTEITLPNEFKTITIKDWEYCHKINGYEFSHAVYENYYGVEIDQIKGGGGYRPQYHKVGDNEDRWSYINYSIYLVYTLKIEKYVDLHYAFYGDLGLTDFTNIAGKQVGLVNNRQVDLCTNDYCEDINGYDLNRIVVFDKTDTEHKTPIPVNYIRISEGKTQYKLKDVDEWTELDFDDVYFLYKPVNTSSSSGDASLSAAPEHHKSIAKTENGYTLSLDVKGAVGTAKPIDILLIVDTSGSMDNKYGNFNKAVDELVRQLDEARRNNPNLDINLAMVRFSSNYGSATNASVRVPWCSFETFGTGRYHLSKEDCLGGTNWEAGINLGSEILSGRTSTKCVIFVTDGDPTCSVTSGGEGNEYKNKYRDDGINAWNNSTVISGAELRYIVQAGTDAKQCGVFSEQTGATPINATKNMENAFSEIAKDIVYPTYKNVSITDTLSDYVTFPDGFIIEDSVKVYQIVKDASGNETKTDITGKCTVAVDQNTKKVTATLIGGGSLEKDVVYRLEFPVIPSTQAYYEYANNPLDGNGERYNDVKGDAGTGATSSEMPGFYSNKNGKSDTFVQYTVGEKTDQSEYEKPVIQVSTDTVERSVEKKWVGDAVDSVTVKLQAKVTVDGQETILTGDDVNGATRYASLPSDMTVSLTGTATAENAAWTYKWTNLPKYYYYKDASGVIQDRVEIVYSVDEVEIEGYGKAISQDPTDATKTIITNTKLGEIQVRKNWSDGAEKHLEDTVYVGLFKTNPELSTPAFVEDSLQSLNASIGWTVTYSGLGNVTGYQAKELVKVSGEGEGTVSVIGSDGVLEYYKMVDENGVLAVGTKNYQVSYTEEQESMYKATTIITNKLLRDVTISKRWVDFNNHYTTRSDKVKLQLQYRESDTETWKNYGEPIELSQGNVTAEDTNIWSYTFRNMTSDYQYQIEEVEVPTGYTESSCETDAAGNLSITNTLNWQFVKRSASEPHPVLEGAEFELKNSNEDGHTYTGVSGVDGVVIWTENGTAVTVIADGEYTLTETKAPAGYTVGKTVEIIVTDGLPAFGTAENVSTGFDKTEKKYELYYDDEVLYSLPSAGSRGIYWYLIGGMLFMMAASLILYKSRCKEVLKS